MSVVRTRVALLLALALAACGGDEPPAAVPANEAAAENMITPIDLRLDNGVVSRASTHDVAATVSRLQGAIEAQNLRLFTTIDHQANAREAGLEMGPATVVLFGNPAIGTPLMRVAPTLALDLPQRMLVYQDRGGEVRVAYDDPRWVAQRHGLSPDEGGIEKVAAALQTLADQATN